MTLADFIDLKGRIGGRDSFKYKFFRWLARGVISAISFDPQSQETLELLVKLQRRKRKRLQRETTSKAEQHETAEKLRRARMPAR